MPLESTLGPLLYHNLFNFAKIKIYTGDLFIMLVNNDISRVNFQNDLNMFYNWCIKWGLVINL